ncbi:MAG: hypothetical protein ACKOB6_09410 [Candidatus Kapaibacterium sp.]
MISSFRAYGHSTAHRPRFRGHGISLGHGLVIVLPLIVAVLFFTGATTSAVAQGLTSATPVVSGLDAGGNTRYMVRLDDGEQLIGTVVDVIEGDSSTAAIKLKTAIGTATIYLAQIREIRAMDDDYRHAHRIFLMPTAEPIGGDHFAGSVELLGLWAGAGIGEVASVFVARTVIPGIASREQVSVCNLKATVYEERYETMTGKMNFAVGMNLAWLNAANRITNVYAAGTFTRVRSRITGIVFGNMSGSQSDLFTATAGTLGSVLVRYPSGSIGFGIGVDTRFPGRQDLHVIAELWNSNIGSANNSLFLLGLRMANSSVSMDFGFAVVPGFTLVPVTSFAWTPF